MATILKIVCMWCKKDMGTKDGNGTAGTTSSICPECWEKHFPGTEYKDGE